ncbi:hypothetical protein HOD20_05160 [archaeon]|jgi:tRNA(Ile)-lysidine synthase TilS/MesJ|nr:hypothetical protein [archaeon]MBT4648415.1 hypothetical protein [archaeon]MBT6821778.1 hypothetical protein [archaeon]MBT7391532.1 hypothetical protein [archaeon]
MNKKISRIIEKRVRKEIRINKLISKNDTILIIDDGSYKFKISQKLLKNIVQDMPVTIEIKKTKYILGDNFDSKWNKIIIPWNLDDENEYFLTSVFKNENSKYSGHFKIKNMQFIKLLINISKEESKEYCEENDIKYENEVNSSDISKYIDLMQKKHPETKFCLLKSSHDLKIKKII